MTHGNNIALNATVQVGYGPGRVLTFEDQIITSPISAGGDSGSLVLSEDNWAIGLLFAGSQAATICSPITTVMKLLNIRF